MTREEAKKVFEYLEKKANTQEPCEVSEYDKDHIWYKGKQYISLHRFLEVKAEAEQEPICDRDCEHCTWTECPIEPCDVSVSEKEPNEITEEVTLRFFKNSLKVRWHDFVIYNVEWLKKNWQMEMDIVCGVKPCDDAISREAVLGAICDYVALEEYEDKSHTFTIRPLTKRIKQLPSVTQKSGKWIRIPKYGKWKCSKCGTKFRFTFKEHDYCPNCGARMESGDKE